MDSDYDPIIGPISDETIEEFRVLYAKSENKIITYDQAREMVPRLLRLYALLLRPLPPKRPSDEGS